MIELPATVPNDREPPPESPRRWARVRARAWIIGLLLIPLLVFWVEYTEIVAEGPDLAAMSLPMAVLFALLILIPINVLVMRFAPKAALSQSELLLIYLMNTVSIGVCGIGFMQFLTPLLVGWSHFATPENHWKSWHYMIRPWAVPSTDVIPGYYAGGTTFFTRANLLGWATPIAVWSGFICALFGAMYCIAVLMRRQWVENERLSFPIVQIPLEITVNGGNTPFWTNRMLWAGIALPVVLETIASLHYTAMPTMPYLPLKPGATLQIDKLFAAPPWNGMGYLVLSFYPMVIGLTYLLSTDVSFSCWFFYVMTKMENVATVALGFRGGGAGPALASVPYINEQSIGAFVGLAVLAVYWARPHLLATFRKAFLRSRTMDDSDEPLSYRMAYLGLAACFLLLIGFGVAMGLSPLLSFVFFALFFVMALTFTRIRAEAGLPWGAGPGNLSHGAIINFGGTASLAPQEMVGLTFLRWFDSDWRCLPQPSQLEAMKLAGAPGRDTTQIRAHGSAEPLGINPRVLTCAIAVATVVGTAAAWVSCLGIYYHFGADSAKVNTWRTGVGNWPFGDLQRWLTHRETPYTSHLGAAAAGLAIVTVLSVLRTRFVWWPFHPIGYAVGNTDAMTWIWFAMFLGWLFKSLTIRYGGIRGYRFFLPFFFGLVLGDYGISGILALISLATGTAGYRTFPI